MECLISTKRCRCKWTKPGSFSCRNYFTSLRQRRIEWDKFLIPDLEDPGPWFLAVPGPWSTWWTVRRRMPSSPDLEPWPRSPDLGALTLEPWPWALSQVKDELWGEGHSHHRPFRSHRSTNSCSCCCLFPLLQAKGCLKHAQCIVDLILKLAVTSVLRWESEGDYQGGGERRGAHHQRCQPRQPHCWTPGLLNPC